MDCKPKCKSENFKKKSQKDITGEYFQAIKRS